MPWLVWPVTSCRYTRRRVLCGRLPRVRPSCSALVAIIAATGSLGCESHSGELPVSETVLPIVGGNLATTCQWPTAVMLVAGVGCSGALVHPRVVVTAKHCLVEGGDPNSIVLGETRDQGAKTVAVSTCYTHPVNDFGICILAEDVTSIPIVPVMAPCEMSALATGAAVVEVGFGVTVPNPRGAYGTKKSIGGSIVTASPEDVDINVTTGSQDGEYYGDSGGPLFFQMPDSTWRVIGEDWGSPTIVGGSTNPRVSTYKSVPYHVAWAEEQVSESGIDLTPCHDANGWNPTADCTGFPTNPGDGVGSWTTLCQGETMLRQPTCQGAPADADAGGEHAEAGAEAGGREGPEDGPGNASSRDSGTGDSQADINADSDTGRAYGDVEATDASDSGQLGNTTDSGEMDAPGAGADSSAGSGGSAGAGGSNADGSGGKGDGSAGAGGSSTSQSARDGASLESAGESKTWDGSGPSSDGGDASARVADGGSGAGSDLSAASYGSESTVDSGVNQKPGSPLGSGCTCRSVSDRDAGAWPSFCLLGLGLAAARLIRRRTRR